MQPVRRQPRLAGRQNQFFRLSAKGCAKNVGLAGGGIFLRARRHAHHPLQPRKQRGAVVAEAVEGAGGDQAFEDALADDARIDA